MLSICIIVKNEESNLRKCLNRLCTLGYEIVIVDTGSTDGTRDVALEFTNAVYDFKWSDDFSEARNYAISKASQNYILMIDSDEFIKSIDKSKVELLINQFPTGVGRVHRENKFLRNNNQFIENELVNRLFSKNIYRYEGRVHEQIVSCYEEQYSTYVLPIYLEHVGYNGDVDERNIKAERNIKLLLRMLEEAKDPYILYQLGKGYYYMENYYEAANYFGMAVEFDLNTKLEYVADLVETYGYALLNSNQVEYALTLEGVYNEFSYSADFVFMMAVVYMYNANFNKAIVEFKKALKYKECKMEGVNSYLAYYNIGVIYECLGDKKSALHYYKLSGNYNLAIDGLKRCTISL